ncbi:MAG TPA: helix-turn-helix domain-containing protein [Myxococcaceae bacterium]|jgi:excisionase family DNA binding protein
MFEEAIRTIVREELRPIREVLETLKVPPTAAELMTAAEAAELARCTPETIRAWVRAGNLTRYGANGRLRVRRDEVLKLLQSESERMTDVQLEAVANQVLGRR